ncbi:MAG TPA: DUF2752 domain-containing protein [Thermoanaerobaculia bacterium]|nr:DUF2752 domain-containing protein [Thermoanaerobaculia bacterium]
MPKVALLALVSAAAAAVAVVLYLFDPAAVAFYPRCMFHALTGLQCPGCGLTRAVHQVLHGDIAEAIRLNAFGIVFAPVVVAGAIAAPPRVLLRPWIGWTAVALVLGWGVARNVFEL